MKFITRLIDINAGVPMPSRREATLLLQSNVPEPERLATVGAKCIRWCRAYVCAAQYIH